MWIIQGGWRFRFLLLVMVLVPRLWSFGWSSPMHSAAFGTRYSAISNPKGLAASFGSSPKGRFHYRTNPHTVSALKARRKARFQRTQPRKLGTFAFPKRAARSSFHFFYLSSHADVIRLDRTDSDKKRLAELLTGFGGNPSNLGSPAGVRTIAGLPFSPPLPWRSSRPRGSLSRASL